MQNISVRWIQGLRALTGLKNDLPRADEQHLCTVYNVEQDYAMLIRGLWFGVGPAPWPLSTVVDPSYLINTMAGFRNDMLEAASLRL